MTSVVPPRRPAALTFLAVCQLVVGIVGLVYEIAMAGFALCFVLSPSAIQTLVAKNPSIESFTEVPVYFETLLTASLAGLVLSIVLIADGIGLLKMRRWAYNLGVLYGWLSIAYQAAWLAFLVVVALPVLMADAESAPVPAAAATTPQEYRNQLKVADYSFTAATAVGLSYPIFVLIMLAVTRKAYRRPASVPPGEDLAAGGEGMTARGAVGPQADPGGEPDDLIDIKP